MPAQLCVNQESGSKESSIKGKGSMNKSKGKVVSVICVDTPENLGIGLDIKKERDAGMMEVSDHLEIDDGTRNAIAVKNINIDLDEIVDRIEDVWQYLDTEASLIDISNLSSKKRAKRYEEIVNKAEQVLEVLSNYLRKGVLPGKVKWY